MENQKSITDTAADKLARSAQKVSITPPPPTPLSIGVLVKNDKDLWRGSDLNLMTYMAIHFNVKLYFFTTKDFNPKNMTVNATLIEGMIKTPETIPLPKIIFNYFGCYDYEPREDIKALIRKNSFFIRDIPYLTKNQVYNLLLADGKFKEFLIETYPLEGFEHFLSLLRECHQDVILKPNGGMQGTGIVRITFKETKYVINDKNGRIFLNTVDELRDYYDEKFSQEEYLLQPYFTSRTKYGNPFDIRLHATRSAEGKFKIIPYTRVCRNPEGLTSNLSAGGYFVRMRKFLNDEFSEDHEMLYKKLLQLGKNFAEYFQTLIPRRIFAIGIDVGLHRRNDSYELKFFEVNVGGPGIANIWVDTAFTNLEYIQYLGKCLAEGTLK